VATVYSIRIRQENRCFRSMCHQMHTINHTYRDALAQTFKEVSRETNKKLAKTKAQELEKEVVTSVCQRLAKIYSLLLHCDCMVTAKLIVQDGEKLFCQTLARSESCCSRDNFSKKLFAVKTGENTAFDTALVYQSTGFSHFHSSDLNKLKDYANERQNWKKHYVSALVVPIRYVDLRKIGQPNCSDDLGFLCVDTLTPNRLKNDWHLALLSGFADQLYNFMSLMRGKYRLWESGTADAS